MTKAEILALGVPEDRVRDFQEHYTRDVRRVAKKQAPGTAPIRAAIVSMLPMIRDTGKLRRVLDLVTRIYCDPSRTEETE